MSRPPYSPAVDGRPEPGEIVWTWVAFEQGSGQGKDRPVLVLDVDGARITGLPLRSRVDPGSREQRRQVWLDLGTGDWDRRGRSSQVQVNRVLTVSIYDARRNGSYLDPEVFDEVLAAARPYLQG